MEIVELREVEVYTSLVVEVAAVVRGRLVVVVVVCRPSGAGKSMLLRSV